MFPFSCILLLSNKERTINNARKKRKSILYPIDTKRNGVIESNRRGKRIDSRRLYQMDFIQ